MDIQVGEAGWRNEAFREGQQGKMMVFFYLGKPEKDNFKSAQEGRVVMYQRPFIKKLMPGQNTHVHDQPATEKDKEEYAQEWARYEQKETVRAVGTPLEMWHEISEVRAAELKYLNVFTVDQLANLADSAGDKIMGFNDLRAKAKAFLSGAKDHALSDKLALQDRQIAELNAKLAALTDGRKKPKKNGWSEEQKRAARERMATARAAKEAKVAA